MSDYWDNYESGPYCRHWSDMGDCDEVCANCGHSCNVHDHFDEGGCNYEGCPCKAWKEAP